MGDWALAALEAARETDGEPRNVLKARTTTNRRRMELGMTLS
jgi:hypothetical protein